MASTDWKKPAIASLPVYSVGSPNVARYGNSKAPSSANISAAFFGSLNEKAVYSSMSSLAFFINILLFLTISRSASLIGFPEPLAAHWRNRCHVGLSLSGVSLPVIRRHKDFLHKCFEGCGRGVLCRALLQW